MATVGKMYWYTRLSCWYCWIDGRKQRLSPDEEDARMLYAEHLVRHGKVRVPTVRDIVAIYLGRKQIAESTREKKRRILMTLVGDYGDLDASLLEGTHVVDWMARHYPRANPTTAHDRIAEVQAAWRYACRHGLIAVSLVHSVDKPTPSQREHHIPRTEWDRYLGECHNPQLRQIVEFGLFTGARAQEAVILTCDDWAGDRFTLPKSRAKGRRAGRLIMVPERLRPSIERLVAERQRGVVFVNTHGKPWSRNSLNCAMRGLKKRLGDPALCYTSLRHSFATAAVGAGVPLEVVSKLMGHSSTKMVYARYARYAKTDVLSDAIERL